MGFFDKLKQGLNRTVRVFKTDVRDLFRQSGRLVDEDFLNELFEILIRTDMGVEAAQETVNEIRTQYRGRVVEQADILNTIKTRLKSLMQPDTVPVQFVPNGPTVILFCGVNGCGKTTSIAKLTKLMKSYGNEIVLGAADTFRAAAVDQLKVWAERLGVDIVTGPERSDPASVAHKAVARAIEMNA
ncbi:MAG: signal recognition particle receptor subunit alpha, partial [Thermoguttaceae bacterium]|nr:signal recognition particle receptor subunit alpha [Thermoguttaceae bacterium]